MRRYRVVYEGLWQRRHKIAVKQLLNQTLRAESLAEFQKEAQTHLALRHPNILTLYGVCLEPQKYALVLEFMAKGSLYDALHNNKEALPWSQRITFALDAASGLLYLHNRTTPILHRDLKSMNILINDRGQAKLSDFGLSKVKSDATMSTNSYLVVGSLLWMAPELFTEANYNQSADIYALGIILWELATRQLPYRGKREGVIIKFVSDGRREVIPCDIPMAFSQLIQRCWAQRTEMRPNSSDVVDAVAHIEETMLSGEITQNKL